MGLAELGLGIGIYIILLIPAILWIWTLIKQAKRGKWVWFVLSLIFPFMIIPYWIVTALGGGK